jgi:hypothetical protein
MHTVSAKQTRRARCAWSQSSWMSPRVVASVALNGFKAVCYPPALPMAA